MRLTAGGLLGGLELSDEGGEPTHEGARVLLVGAPHQSISAGVEVLRIGVGVITVPHCRFDAEHPENVADRARRRGDSAPRVTHAHARSSPVINLYM